MLSEAVASEAGKVLLPYVLEKVAAQNNSTIKNTQAGQAGAVPAPDTAPLTGGAHEAIGTVIHDTVLQYVDDRTATNFNQHNTGKMSDLANEELSEDGHSTNGKSYSD